MSIPLPERYIAIPHSILRRQARLSGAELHLLLAIADQTLGYAEGAGRRESTWISHQRFKALTGLSNDAISRASLRLSGAAKSSPTRPVAKRSLRPESAKPIAGASSTASPILSASRSHQEQARRQAPGKRPEHLQQIHQ